MLVAEFNRLLISNTESLKPFAITFTRNSEEASDLLQDTFCKAISNKEKYNPGTNITAWLYTIMRNIFINSCRRRVTENNIFDYTASSLQDHHISPLMNAEGHVYCKEIQQAVSRLPETMRTPFVLLFEGYKYKEISYLLQEPLGTVKSRVHAARKALKESVAQY